MALGGSTAKVTLNENGTIIPPLPTNVMTVVVDGGKELYQMRIDPPTSLCSARPSWCLQTITEETSNTRRELGTLAGLAASRETGQAPLDAALGK